jgi:hypothetical protein
MGLLRNTTNADFFEEKKSELDYYGSESNVVENEITLAIQSLSQINEGIDQSLKEIAEKKAALNDTEQKLLDMKAKNVDTIAKYNTLFASTETEGEK